MGIQIKLKLWEDFSFHLDIILSYPPRLAQMLMVNFFWEYFQKKPYPLQNICADFVYNPPRWNTSQKYPQYRFLSTTAFFLILLFLIFGQILSTIGPNWPGFSGFFSNLKVHLISKGLFDVIVSTKKPTEFSTLVSKKRLDQKNKGTLSLIWGYLT